jgi:hypothetical protein
MGGSLKILEEQKGRNAQFSLCLRAGGLINSFYCVALPLGSALYS